MTQGALAIVVGGGPAPGINGVISSAAIEGINRGHRVFGVLKGFEHISKGVRESLVELSIGDVSRILSEGGSILYTSRANPKNNPEMLGNIVSVLKERGIEYLITIGGDDTASSAQAVARAANGEIRVVHVPKTIDNDLPLPGKDSTFGFQTAREVGTEIVETLMEDAKTTGRWYLVVAMGRKAGHLALGIGMSASATLTLIPEEFSDAPVPLSRLSGIICGSILKRLAGERPYGVVVLAEGLAEVVQRDSIPELAHAERDPHGNIRFAEVDFGPIIREAVKSRLKEMGLKLTVVDKNVGYELRCRPPNSFDREYTRQLGYAAVDFLLSGGSEAMVSRQGNELVPIPFADMIDEASGKTRIRVVDTNSALYKVARKYMIHLNADDIKDKALLASMARYTKLSVAEFSELIPDLVF